MIRCCLWQIKFVGFWRWIMMFLYFFNESLALLKNITDRLEDRKTLCDTFAYENECHGQHGLFKCIKGIRRYDR